MIPYQTSKEIEKAIVFLVQAITSSGNNPKPVILHSILVGLSLAKSNYPLHVIQAGFLHDTVEDSETNIDTVKERFGEQVATLVSACTYDHSIKNKSEQYKSAMSRAVKVGKDALIVMAADLIQYPWDKIAYFIKIAETILKDEPIWRCLEVVKQKIYGTSAK